MGWRPYRAAKKALGLLTEKEFFQATAEQAGYLDPELVKRVYNAMLRVIIIELKTKGALRLPQLCDFHLLLAKGKRIKNYKMKVAMIKPDHHQLRIRPMYTIRRIIKGWDLDGEGGRILDPALRLEKVPGFDPISPKSYKVL